jgi:hypothetical protein
MPQVVQYWYLLFFELLLKRLFLSSNKLLSVVAIAFAKQEIRGD